jgi:hypothetical protein
MTLTSDHIDAMAPDASSVAAGRKLAKPATWSGLGQSSSALWGECRGSSVYQVQVDLSGMAYKCSCPSRKLPCKHVLGLLYMAASEPEALPVGGIPERVSEWLEKRRVRLEQKAEKAERKTETIPVDAEAQAARREKREQRVGEGLELLSLWLEDIVRTGIASLAEKGPSFFADQAARLVDAQAPALAGRLRTIGEQVASGPDWPERVLAELGRVSLLLEAWQRLEALPAPLQADVRSRIGWTSGQDEVLAEGERVWDTWLVAGQGIELEERLRVQRTWLWGASTGRAALDLQFSAAGQPFGQLLAVGTAIRGELAFWPSACPQRARFAAAPEALPELPADLIGVSRCDDVLDTFAANLARLPWLEQQLFCLKQGTAFRHDAAFLATTGYGKALPLAGRALWKLLAVTGGRPVDMFGLWDGFTFRVTGVMTPTGFTAIEPLTTE